MNNATCCWSNRIDVRDAETTAAHHCVEPTVGLVSLCNPHSLTHPPAARLSSTTSWPSPCFGRPSTCTCRRCPRTSKARARRWLWWASFSPNTACGRPSPGCSCADNARGQQLEPLAAQETAPQCSEFTAKALRPKVGRTNVSCFSLRSPDRWSAASFAVRIGTCGTVDRSSTNKATGSGGGGR